MREKIPWEEIKYFNNKVVCELIEGKQPPGLFSVIDDVCAAMAKEKEAVADIKMLDKLDGAHCGHPHFKRTDRGFMIKHYAGDVHYDAAGFTTRNKDTLSNDIILVLCSAKDNFLQELLIDITSEASQAGSPTTGAAKKKSTTAGFKIRQQAADLVKTLTSCTPHYVRTIKSNDEKRANFIDEPRVTHQVKYLGLLENIRVRRAGYSYRQYFDKFLKRFKYTCPATFPRPFRGTDKDACAAILNHVGVVPREAWNLGESKLFIRQPQHLFALEDVREKAFGTIVLKIQRAWTRYRNSKEYIVLKTNMDKIYRKGGKERRADSVFKPYQGDYLNYRGNLQFLHPLVDFDVIASAWKEYWADGGKRYYYNFITQQTQWVKPQEMNSQRIIFTDKVERVVNHDKALKATEYFIVSDRALYLIEEQVQTIVTPPTKPTKQNPKPAPPPAPYQVTSHVLKKRLDIRLISGVSVSQQADCFVVVHTYPAPVPYRAVTMTQVVKGTPPACQLCGVKLPPAAKKGNCPGCGVLACMKTCLVHQRPLPTLGYVKPVPVCPHCMVGEPYEAVEDIIISNAGKSEIVAMLRKVYKQVMGHKIPINVNNTIQYQLYGEKGPRTAVFQLNPAVKEDMLYPAPNQLVVHCPAGIQQAKIAAIETAREERRKIAQERYKREQEEAKQKEIQKEAEREEQRKRMVEERKAAKRDAEERAEADRLERERLARERRESSAKAVAAKSSK